MRRTCRNLLLICAAVHLFSSVYTGASWVLQSGLPWKPLGLTSLHALALVVLALLARRHPLLPSVTALLLLIGVTIGSAIFDPATLTRGIALRVVCFALVIASVVVALRWRRTVAALAT